MNYLHSRIFLCVAVSLLSESVQASPILLVQAQAQVTGGGEAVVNSAQGTSGEVRIEAADSANFPDLQFVGASAGARAAFGHIGALAMVGGSSLTEFGLNAGGNGHAQWWDDFLITSEVLPVGTPVVFRATAEMNGFFDLYQDGVAAESDHEESGGAATEVHIFGAVASTPLMALIRDQTLTADGGYCTSCGDLPASAVALVTIPVGSTVQVTQWLNVFALMRNMLDGGAQSHFYTSAHFYFDPVEAGYGYTTASGTDYRSPAQSEPVPEPSSMTLVATGILLTARRLRGQDRRASSAVKSESADALQGRP